MTGGYKRNQKDVKMLTDFGGCIRTPSELHNCNFAMVTRLCDQSKMVLKLLHSNLHAIPQLVYQTNNSFEINYIILDVFLAFSWKITSCSSKSNITNRTSIPLYVLKILLM